MTEGFAANTQILDGLYALGSQDKLNGGPATSSVEWLLQVVERHAAAEQDALGEYAFVAEASADPVVALVMRIILDDEVRHHGLLQRMKATPRDALEWTRSPSALPTASLPEQPLTCDLVTLTNRLVDEERTGAKMLRDLAHKEKLIDAGLHSVLLEMMAIDSDKHARLLEFVQHRLEARASATDGPSD